MARLETSGRWAAALVVALSLLDPPAPAAAQAGALGTPPAPPLQIKDGRLALALSRLLAGSPSADAVLESLASSGLPVLIGTPSDLAAAVADDGTRSALLPDASGLASPAEPQLAWVGFRVAIPEGTSAGTLGRVEQAWIVVDVDRMQRLIHDQGHAGEDRRLTDDLTIALGHELVAHVGSVAATRRIEDLCDDPVPGAGPAGRLACSIQIENQVRRELNTNLALRGQRRYAERTSYALDGMNFAGVGAP